MACNEPTGAHESMHEGNDSNGFSVELEGDGSTIRVSGWGLWGPDLAQRVVEGLTEHARRARRPHGLLADFSRLGPQGGEGQAAIRSIMLAARGSEVAGAAMIVTNAITKLQVVRIAKENTLGRWTYHATEDAARTALGALR